MTKKLSKAVVQQRRKRILLTLFGCVMFVLMMSVGLMGMVSLLPTHADFTQTAVIQAQSDYRTQISESHAIRLTQAELGIDTNTPEPDAFELTATALIGQLTKDLLILTDVASGITTLTPSATPLP